MQNLRQTELSALARIFAAADLAASDDGGHFAARLIYQR
jgi:hypothetical protein